jgi:hypothetical protein
MSHQKRKKTNAVVPSSAIGGGRPIMAAIVGGVWRAMCRIRDQRTDGGGRKTEKLTL